MDAVIVGGGLAGLACAHTLQEQGLSFQLVEASDGLGGRVRTDRAQGFLLDRGFQVFLTAYPEAQRVLDYNALDLKVFYPGALIQTQGRFERLADPWRQPLDAIKSLFSPVATLLDRLLVARLRADVCRGSLEDVFGRPDRETSLFLQERGFSSHFIDNFFRPFFGGIFLDDQLETSSRMFEFVFRMMATGDVAIPADGMNAIPDQLAASLPEDAVQTNAPVQSVAGDGVTLETGEQLRASAIVVATNGSAAHRLLPNVPDVGSRKVTCFYYASDKPPLEEPVLVLNGDQGVINNLAVLSNVAPSYAPSGSSLISVTSLRALRREDVADCERDARNELRDWFGGAVDKWDLLRSYHIPEAQPRQNPPLLSPPERPVRLGEGIYVCGDHRTQASIQGALLSGRHAAEAVVQDLLK